ncbi:MAG: c-type cytochrome [Pedosphaera sp.]|nr:c-type cytochrome [Pedosphaera sp.]
MNSIVLRSSGFALAAWCVLLLVTPVAHAASPLPQPLPNWRIELVAEAPRIKHPSVVACAPDGRVFVAEDPMDISLPKADAAEGRILCLFPDGRITVFAEKLFAVFGLQYLEGRLYVLHNPKFSVFDDDNGVGGNRRELIEQTLPEPSALNWNDHVPANFRLGMDGFFYVASGDKGLHGAKGTDGLRADLYTGGVFRIRPDGTQLEVFSHGVRNILDVALNAEDDIFTYDNTDEHDWMGRFTHMVEAGFYGYPHDFIPQRPYTLWMMADYGAGAACGTFANNEDSLPPEYQGNVFLSDFGKRQVMRVRIERDGATYRAASKEDLFPNPPGDFRPVGITPGPDGKSIYICDWQHRDEKANVSVGRLFKLTWTGPDLSSPKPAWYLPAATGKKFEASTSELARGLSHPSHSVRLTAQRRLAERNSIEELLKIVQDTSAPAHARQHALWALDALDGGRSARKDIIAMSTNGDASVSGQAIRQLGTRRATIAVPALRERLNDKQASVRFHAATALGRIGDAVAVPALLAALEEQDMFARYAVFTALNRIGTSASPAWLAIVRGLESDSARIREGTMFALRETYDQQLLDALVQVFKDTSKPVETRRVALGLIAALHLQKPAWKGQWWAYHPALQPPPAKTEEWAGTATVLSILREGLRESEPTLRRACIDGLAAAKDTESAAALRQVFALESDSTSRATILRALGAMKDQDVLRLVAVELKRPSQPETTTAAITAAENLGNEEAIQVLIEFLRSSTAQETPLAQAVSALGKLRASTALSVIQPLTLHAAAPVRVASVQALGRLQGEAALPVLEAGLRDSTPEVRRAAVKALAELRSTNAAPSLIKAYADEALRDDVFQAVTRAPDERAIEILLDGLSSKNPVQRDAAHLAIRNISARVLKPVEARAGELSSQALIELRQIYAGNKAAEGGPLFVAQIKQHTLDEYLTAASNGSGDVARGRRLFADAKGVNCVACHRVAGEGSDLGPDLTSVGIQFDRRALAEAILFPSKTVREGYQMIAIEMLDGEEWNGLVKGETADTLILRDSAGREHKLPRASIKSRQSKLISLMPEGLHAALSLEEFLDLVTYLESLKATPAK